MVIGTEIYNTVKKLKESSRCIAINNMLNEIFS